MTSRMPRSCAPSASGGRFEATGTPRLAASTRRAGKAPLTQPDLSAVRAHWFSGLPFDALDELDLVDDVSTGTHVALLRRAVTRDAVGVVNDQFALPGAGGGRDAGGCRTPSSRATSTADFRCTLPSESGDFSLASAARRSGRTCRRPDGSDGSRRTPLHLACALQSEETARQLVDRGADVRARTHYDGWTPLHEAVKCSTELVGLLLARGAAPDAATDGGYTPLHRASVLGRVENSEVLLQAGASLGATDKEGLTALHFAAGNGESSIVQVLLASGADRTAVDIRGRTAADVAAESGHVAIERLLSTKP